jgi:hypothetical protein
VILIIKSAIEYLLNIYSFLDSLGRIRRKERITLWQQLRKQLVHIVVKNSVDELVIIPDGKRYL